MKAKYIMIILILNYLLILLFCAFSELLFLNNKATEVQLMIRTAADMALEQVQATDDFFEAGAGYMLDAQGVANGDYLMKVPDGGTNYIEVPAYEAMTGQYTKGDIYNAVYGNGRIPKFLSENENVLDIEGTVGYWNGTRTGMAYYKVPRISQMGLPITGSVAKRAYFQNMAVTDTTYLEGIWENYNLNSAKKTATFEGSVEEYYVSPLSLGITYINEEILQYFFMNNLDLLMRGKYSISGKDLNTVDGGNGILKGTTYSDLVSDSLSNSNPINNGSFTLLRGLEIKDAVTGATFYKGVMPTIRYKVIDMFDSANDGILSALFGGTPTKNGSKAEYFKELSNDTLDPSTGLPYEHKPIVVAEVTFYADVIIPYSSVSIRELRGKVSDDNTLATEYLSMSNPSADSDNYVDLLRIGQYGSGVNGGLGNTSDCIVYTKLFAVAP